MHSWETLFTVTGKRNRGRPVSVYICRGCGMLWNSSIRRPVPIYWSRYVAPRRRHWWAEFQRLDAERRAIQILDAAWQSARSGEVVRPSADCGVRSAELPAGAQSGLS